MRIPCCRLCIVLALMLMACSQALADTNPEQIAASALFERFETVFYAKYDIVSSSGAYKRFSELESATLHYPFALLPGALNSLGKQASADILESGEAVLVGAKDFRPPSGLGQVHSQVCYIVILRSNNAFELRKYFTSPPSGSIAGSSVWNWSAKLSEFGRDDPRPSLLYAAQIAQAYLLVSNDLADLQTIARRLSSPDQDLCKSTQIPDWETVSHHRLWGYRRYRHSGIVNREAAGMTDVTRGAEALMFYIDFDKKEGVLRLFSSVTDESTPAKMNTLPALPRFKRSGPGVWETVTLFTGDEDSFERMFAIMYLFGFGIYV